MLNPAENNVLITSDAESGTYELLTFPNDAAGDGRGGGAGAGGERSADSQDVKRGSGLAAVFIARNRFAVLDKNRQILIKNFANEVTKKVAPPNPSTDGMFFAGASGRLLLRSDDRITLFEQQSRRVLAELQVPRVKYVVWNKDCTCVALLSKHGIIIATRELEQLCAVSETVRVKSGAWDINNRVFLYTTLNHCKYCLPNGDVGIIRTLDAPVYVTKAHNKQLFCLDRECKTRSLSIDNTEAIFKLALADKNFGEVMRMVRHSRLCGQAIIAYLQRKGFPEVALHFVDDKTTRFKLALACGNIEVAMHTANELNDDACWHQLGVEALRQGNHQVVEMAYQRTKNFERLSFLYLLTGNTEKLRKMLKIAEMRHDVMARFHNALFLGDVSERVKVLEEAGQLALAYLTAATHGRGGRRAPRRGAAARASAAARARGRAPAAADAHHARGQLAAARGAQAAGHARGRRGRRARERGGAGRRRTTGGGDGENAAAAAAAVGDDDLDLDDEGGGGAAAGRGRRRGRGGRRSATTTTSTSATTSPSRPSRAWLGRRRRLGRRLRRARGGHERAQPVAGQLVARGRPRRGGRVRVGDDAAQPPGRHRQLRAAQAAVRRHLRAMPPPGLPLARARRRCSATRVRSRRPTAARFRRSASRSAGSSRGSRPHTTCFSAASSPRRRTSSTGSCARSR